MKKDYSVMPVEGQKADGAYAYVGNGGLVTPNAGMVFSNGKWVSPLTYQAEQLASQKIGYENQNLGLQNQIMQGQLQNQQVQNQVAGTAGNRLNTLLQDPSSISSDPGYQFQYNQGLEAVNRTAAAKGMLGSGNRLYDLTQYGQDRAKTSYGDTVNRLGNLLTGTANSSAAQSANNKNNKYQTDAYGGMTLGGSY